VEVDVSFNPVDSTNPRWRKKAVSACRLKQRGLETIAIANRIGVSRERVPDLVALGRRIELDRKAT
jgi:orotate phosphoribosyltransferase-like protein